MVKGQRPRSKKSPPVKRSPTSTTSGGTETSAKGHNGGSFPVVGIGASAGGLEAFTRLLQHLPADTGMSFVLVQHLDPVRESALTKLLSKATTMPVREVTNNTRVQPNQVHIIPPNASLTIAGGVLKLQPRKKTDGQHRPIDHFFQSLAEDLHERAISVILSGTASDGTLGCELIKAEGGITFAQDESAKYESMPRSAIAAGCIDFVLSPEEIAKELARIARHPYVRLNGDEQITSRDVEEGLPDSPKARKTRPGAKDPLEQIVALLRNTTGVDFSLYKSNTINRRITRRMVLGKAKTLHDYLRDLKSDATELDTLYQDLLIGVTGFFRNPEAFEVLKLKVFPRILKNRSPNASTRVWVLGCSTGQEAYSIAMAYLEFAGKANSNLPLQIFATDLNDGLLEKARSGLYAQNLVQDLSPERLRRFFVQEDGGYRISKSIREMCVFARQNLITDPPFSRLDLISCRNLMIYLEPGLQRKIIPTFHYALKPNGFLFLGESETVGANTDLFAPVDKRHKVYSKKPATTRPLNVPGPMPHSRLKQKPTIQPLGGREGSELDAQQEADRITLSKYAPAGVVINAELEVLQFRGMTSPYLSPAPGRASFNLLKLAREGLMLPLRAAINKAKQKNQRVRKENVQVDLDGSARNVNLEVIPLKRTKERNFLVLFEPRRTGDPAGVSEDKTSKLKNKPETTRRKETRKDNSALDENVELKRELAETREYLQTIQEEHEAANEELQASNEEVQSANEELQSINEELETSKEELESTNEELITVNEEMQTRNLELNRLNSDLSNLHNSVDMSIVVLGRDLTIRRFTPRAETELNLVATDIGQPISRIKINLDFPDLEKTIAKVIKTMGTREKEVQSKEGGTYSLRMRPYVTIDNKIDGAVLVLVDITDVKQTEQRIREERNYAQAIIRTVQHPLLVLDDKLSVTTANESFYRTFQVSPKETEGRLIYDLGERQWDIPKLRTLLEEILLENNQIHDFEVDHEFEDIGTKSMLLNARRLDQQGERSQLILLAIEDITERNQTQKALLENEELYRTLFNLTPMAVYTIDASGVIVNFNRYAAELWGREPVLGDTDLRFCGSFKMFRPDGSFMPHEECPMADVVSGKVSSVQNGEVLIERPDGSHVTVIVNIRPLKNERREVTGAINCFYDITERKQAEALILLQKEALEMAASGESLVQVLEFLARTAEGQSQRGAMMAIHLLDETGTRFEQTVAPSLPTSYLLATNAMEVSSGTGPCCAAIALRQRVTVGDVATSEQFPAFAEFALPLGIRAGWSTPIFASTGTVLGTFANYFPEAREPSPQDDFLGELVTRTASVIIEREQVEEELNNLMHKEKAARAEAEAANRVKDEFLAIVSHELRTPLNAIVGWTHLLRNGKLDQRDTERAIQTIDRNASAQATIINELLDVSRIISGKLKLDMKPVDLADVINDAIDVVRAAADAKAIEVVTSLDQTAGLVAGEAVRLQQVIWNLLSNAIKFTPNEGSIKVELKRAGSQVAVVVSDTGGGIPSDFLPHIFERFQQADTTEKRMHGGLGLGLSIVHNLVEMHGGTVSAESEGQGRGTRFTVTLPILAVSGATTSLPASRDRSSELPVSMRERDEVSEEQNVDLKPDLLKGVRVLAVDDQADTRDLIILALTRYGAEVRACTSAIEACQMIQGWKPKVIVSDIGMPGEDGYDLMRTIRARAPESGGQIPAIALTGYAGPVDESKAFAAGYQVHMTKPVALRELAVTIARLSGIKAKHHEA